VNDSKSISTLKRIFFVLIFPFTFSSLVFGAFALLLSPILQVKYVFVIAVALALLAHCWLTIGIYRNGLSVNGHSIDR
jgi:hypothetical protein